MLSVDIGATAYAGAMLLRSVLTLLSLLLVLTIAPASAGAVTVEDCQTQLAALRADTATTATFVNAKDQLGLLDKIDSGAVALSIGKSATTVAKLTDFRVKVQALGPAGKLAAEDAARLEAEAAAVIACVESPPA